MNAIQGQSGLATTGHKLLQLTGRLVAAWSLQDELLLVWSAN